MNMRWRRANAVFSVLVVLVVVGASFVEQSPATEEPTLEFRVVDVGDMSGCFGEDYFVVRSEAEWVDLWEQHMAIVLPSPPVPEIDFSTELVVCSFMGERPTAGYSTSIVRIWVEEEEVHVEVAKLGPSEDAVVADVITHPYMFVSIETVDMEFRFEITEEDGDSYEFLAPRQPDVNGDSFCGIDDLVGIAEHFGSKLGEPGWLSKCDIDRDGYIGINDIIEAAKHFGQTF